MLDETLAPDKPAVAVDVARWAALKDRLADELSRGFTLQRLANETRLEAKSLELWANDPNRFREPNWRVGELPLAEKIENALAKRFGEIDAERAEERRRAPGRVETSVMRQIIEGFEMAREVTTLVDITAPPGSGKDEALREYIARRRKEEGFSCPVWSVELSEFSLSAKAVLSLIDGQVWQRPCPLPGEFDLAKAIEEKTEGRGGLLIINEAQHLGDAQNINGIRIINGLRRFVDRGLFGIALLNNGEVYRRLAGRKSEMAQLLSRMESWRVEVKGVTEHDVDLVMAAWAVSGKEERAWCVKVGTGPGQLRALVEAFKRALHKYGEIRYATLTKVRPG